MGIGLNYIAMGRWIILLMVFAFSCGPKVSTLEDYEKRNPYPGTQERTEYSSRGSLMPKEGYQDLYSEKRASRVGDVIYLQIVESINAIESISAQTQRSSAFKQGISSFFEKYFLSVMAFVEPFKEYVKKVPYHLHIQRCILKLFFA